MNFDAVLWKVLLWPGVAAAIAAGVALIVHWLTFAALARVAANTQRVVDDALVRRSRRPVRVILIVLAINLVLPETGLAQNRIETLDHLLALGLIAGIAWLLISLLAVFDDYVSARWKPDNMASPEARRLRTQAQLFHRIGVVIIVAATFAGMLMTFPSVRHIGVSLFASAGIVGLIAGIAARPTLSNVIAGLQVALTDSVRIGDVVVVEGQWGRIEDITTTYITVRIWDLRTLVLPLSYFIEKPFENWTKTGTALLGTVMVYADYTVPVETVREELKRILDASKLWDGKTWGLQVTGASDHAVELRALFSALDSSALWDLRCLVRERLVAFLQERYPQSLPKTRAEVTRH